MKIIITGGSGLLGQYLNKELSKGNDIITLYNSNVGNCLEFNSLRIDITDIINLQRVFNSFSPDIVIHTAAISRPETAASLSNEVVNKVNVKATEDIAKLCDKYSTKLIYTSTDLVYDGDAGSMLKEDSKLNPKSLYAETKLMGEIKIKEVFENYIILRTSLLYGIGLTHTINNFHNMLNNLKEVKMVKLFYDQFRTPLSLNDAARLINRLISNNDIINETFNFGGVERVSRLELGEILCNEGGFDKNLLLKTSMYDMPNLPPVADVSMDTSKLRAFGIIPLSIKESVKEILSTLD